MAEAICEIYGVKKSYGNYQALHGIDIKIMNGEFIAIVGPSGSGKSTLLQIISGFESANEGTLYIDGTDMADVPPAQRPTSMVFQKLALFPHKTVAENIGFPLKLRKVPKAEIDARTREILALMELKPEYLARYPRQLSGGEQQRVALARSMIQRPKLLLLDEPLSALDAKLKKVLQAEIKRLHRNVGMTFIHVTHDLEEAMMLADHVCVMNGGRIMQIGAPEDIYHRPANRFVAEFIGDTNLIPVEITAIDAAGAHYKSLPNHALAGIVPLPPDASTYRVGQRTDLMVRPESLKIVDTPTPGEPSFSVKITATFMRGASTQLKASALDSDKPFTIELSGYRGSAFDIGQVVALQWDRDDAYLLPMSQQS